jgi:glycosyltransferase involved in cell wall biosynthesis
MKVLFIHKHMPGQFEHLLRALAADSRHEVVCIGQAYTPQRPIAPTPRVQAYRSPAVAGSAFQGLLRSFEEAVGNGLAVAAKLRELAGSGFVPDIAIAHLGWGEALYFKDVFPDTPLLGFCEFYHHARGVDADFDPEFPLGHNDTFRIRTMNAAKLVQLTGMDLGVSPTLFQRSLFPAEFRRKITVIHEGVDTSLIRPRPDASYRLSDGTVLRRGEPVVTYATRNLEPYRGFHVFARAAAELCRRRQDCRIVIAGADEVSYSAVPSRGTYRQRMLREVDLDPRRVHFVGRLAFEEYVALLQVSAVHVYLTVPFVLSWSLLEAMSAGCVIVASDTAPVREVLRHEENALLVDFFSHRGIAAMVERVLEHPQRLRDLGQKARLDVVRDYDARLAVVRYWGLIERLAANHGNLRSAVL